jgi:hypothetical protein
LIYRDETDVVPRIFIPSAGISKSYDNKHDANRTTC